MKTNNTKETQLQKLALSATAACTAETITYPLDLLKTRLQLSTTSTSLAALLTQQGPRSLYAGISPALVRHIPYTSVRIFTFESIKKSFSSDDNSKNSSPPLIVNLASGMIAGGLGQTLASPADLIKVRMQADGKLPLEQRRYRGIGHAFTTIIKQDGISGLWRGSLPAVQRAALVNLGELTTYDTAKRTILQSGITGHKDNIYTHFLSSICSGFVASLVSTPADVVKSRLMNQDPLKPLYKGMADCFVVTWRGEGLRGLYKGFVPTWARLGPWQLTFWVSYEQLRKASGLEPF